MYSEFDKRNVDGFFETIAPWSAAYTQMAISVVAVRRKGVWALYSASTAFGAFSLVPRVLKTATILAGRTNVELQGKTPRQAFDSIVANGIELDGEGIKFLASETQVGSFSTHFSGYSGGSQTQTRQAFLRMMGKPLDEFENKEPLSWELMAASRPYVSFAELMAEDRLPDPNNRGSYFECWAHAPCVIHADHSSLVNGRAVVAVHALSGLDPSKITVGMQQLRGSEMTRGQLKGDQFVWETEGEGRTGRLALSIPVGTALRLLVSYDGHIQHHYWLIDFSATPNPGRALFQAFDPKLETLADILQKQPDRRQDGKEFELAIGWLFTMLGFHSISLAGSRRLSDAPDTIVRSANGVVCVVESTTGTLRAESKLSNLVQRAEMARSALARANLPGMVLPIICTSLGDDEIRADSDQAQQMGVAVVSAAKLEDLLTRTMLYPDSDAVVAELQANLDVWRRTHEMAQTRTPTG